MKLLRDRRPPVERLARQGSVTRLVEALDYEDPVLDRSGERVDLGTDVRVAAVQALATLDGAAADAGLQRALADPEMAVRRAAVHALAGSSDTGVQALATVAADWRGADLAETRNEAITALGRFDAPTGARAYAAAALAGSHPVSEDDGAILRFLGQGDGGRATDAAIELLAGHLVEGATAQRAAALLGHLAPASVSALLAALDEPPSCRAACLGLGATHDSRAVPRLCDVLGRSADVAARAAAAQALGEIMDPSAAEALMIATGDGDYTVRVAAIRSFNQLGNVAVTAGLAAAVRGALTRGGPVSAAQLTDPPAQVTGGEAIRVADVSEATATQSPVRPVDEFKSARRPTQPSSPRDGSWWRRIRRS